MILAKGDLIIRTSNDTTDRYRVVNDDIHLFTDLDQEDFNYPCLETFDFRAQAIRGSRGDERTRPAILEFNAQDVIQVWTYGARKYQKVRP